MALVKNNVQNIQKLNLNLNQDTFTHCEIDKNVVSANSLKVKVRNSNLPRCVQR